MAKAAGEWWPHKLQLAERAESQAEPGRARPEQSLSERIQATETGGWVEREKGHKYKERKKEMRGEIMRQQEESTQCGMTREK